MYRNIDRATSDVQAHEPLSADVQAATLMSLRALAGITPFGLWSLVEQGAEGPSGGSVPPPAAVEPLMIGVESSRV